MGKCRWCNKRGLFLKVDVNGLCAKCYPIVYEIEGAARVLSDSLNLISTGKSFKTRIGRCADALLQCERLLKFEDKGIPTISPLPSETIRFVLSEKDRILAGEAEAIAQKALAKAQLSSTAAAKERVIAAAMLKIEDLVHDYGASQTLIAFQQDLQFQLHQVRMAGILLAAEKAEFKGQDKKAKDLYNDALFFLRTEAPQTPDFKRYGVEIEDRMSKLDKRLKAS